MMTGIDNGITAAAEQIVDLSNKINKAECYARNESNQYPMSNLFIGDSRLGCKSDADEQLILHIAFQEFVKVRFENEETGISVSSFYKHTNDYI